MLTLIQVAQTIAVMIAGMLVWSLRNAFRFGYNESAVISRLTTLEGTLKDTVAAISQLRAESRVAEMDIARIKERLRMFEGT